MQVAEAAVPGAAPRVLGQHAALGVLVMEYLPPGGHTLWKEQLRRGIAEPATAQAVGDTLGRIHAHAAARADALRGQFDSDRIFFEIRLEPYLLATATRHADLAAALQALVAQTQAHPLGELQYTDDGHVRKVKFPDAFAKGGCHRVDDLVIGQRGLT